MSKRLYEMTSLPFESEPLAVQVQFLEDQFTVDLADGQKLAVPLSWYPRLFHAS
ncbi:MAG: DUF2442 domain-containing protein [Oculatellaceae cyanobacterium Prado106]|nr:DUF2442 domain-containing protein [Oculatellaceae cyanobacterium Prado106]